MLNNSSSSGLSLDVIPMIYYMALDNGVACETIVLRA